jgi:hypothetical protein
MHAAVIDWKKTEDIKRPMRRPFKKNAELWNEKSGAFANRRKILHRAGQKKIAN